MSKPAPPITPRLSDPDAERVRLAHDQKFREILALPAIGLTSLGAVSLVDGVETPIPHSLGRTPVMVFWSPPRGAASTGRIEEVRDGLYDRSQYVTLKATGYGATVSVDLAVM